MGRAGGPAERGSRPASRVVSPWGEESISERRRRLRAERRRAERAGVVAGERLAYRERAAGDDDGRRPAVGRQNKLCAAN
jgi:hypothetical protein